VRIFSDVQKNVAYLEGVGEVFTGALIAARVGDLISIYHSGLNYYEVRDYDYRNIVDASGQGFDSAQSTLEYLQKVFTVQQNASLTYYFTSPLMVWVINHNLNYFPSTKIYSVGGAEIEGDILNVTMNQVQISFVTPTAGFARLF
jgi:hypothetical protein